MGESAVKVKKGSEVLTVHQNDIKSYDEREQPDSEGVSEREKLESESENEDEERNESNSGDEGAE